MIRLREGTAESQRDLHSRTPVRIYENDGQASRIKLACEMCTHALDAMRGDSPAHERRTVIELGCGMADISGWLSMGHNVTGYEVAVAPIVAAARRWPWMTIEGSDIQTEAERKCDLLILCETLEHVADPNDIAKRWLPLARYALISSPLQGDRDRDMSGGEHLWSFDKEDFTNFFEIGGHEIIEDRLLTLYGYTIQLMLGKRTT